MDSLRGLPALPGPAPVTDRNGGRRQADAFRRAMAQGGGSNGRPTAGDDVEQPVRRTLQPAPPGDRKNEGKALHVDVFA